MVGKEFIIASDTNSKSGEELLLHNLELRLRIQKEWVSKTESEIEYVKSIIKKKNQGG